MTNGRTMESRRHCFGMLGVLWVLCFVTPELMARDEPVAQPAQQAEWPFQIGAAQRPGVYWWCPGSAFTKEDLDWNLEQIRAGGFGLVHVIPIYGARGAEDRYISYLSPKWMEMLDYMVKKADSLGIIVDMTTGTGWCFGGPDLPADAIDAKVRYDKEKNTVTLTPGMRVKRPAPGGEGPMLNPYSPRAMDLYLDRFSKAFDQSKSARPRAQYHDSFEYSGNWSAELLDAFKAGRGYDLREHFQAFFGAVECDAEKLARLKCDYRQTLAELHCDSIRRWTTWANGRGMLTRDQAHGSPANLLDVYAAADIPEPEMFGSPTFPIAGFRRDEKMSLSPDCDPNISMLASSAAHVAHRPGRQLVTSETCTWMREHWHETLGQIKLEADLFLLAGVNQMLIHGYTYSPKDAPWPGWFFYAATQMNWRNSIWRDVPHLANYVGRCQSVLQAGQPANDVLLYWPLHDLWMDPKGLAMKLTVHDSSWMEKHSVGVAANALRAKGFAFDFISDLMVGTLNVEKGLLAAPGGTYRALVVPACRYMPEATLRHLADLREQGAMIVFEQAMPADVPGFVDLEKRRVQLAADRTRLEKSGAIIANDVLAGLAKADVPRETLADHGLRYIRRKTGDAHWYFIANHTAKDFDGWLGLSVPCLSTTLYDPMTGRSGRLVQRQEDSGKQVYLQLAAGETIILCASARESYATGWAYLKSAGEPVMLSGEWSVAFIDGGPELPAAYRIKELTSWTTAPDKKAQAFAGTARYTLCFNMPKGDVDDWLLDLGDVRESARVRLNGRDVGTRVAIPFRFCVGAYLTSGENTLEIEVTNLSANRIRDLELRKVDWKIMKDINIVNLHYQKFKPGEWPLEPSGLLGPVRLIPQKKRSVGGFSVKQPAGWQSPGYVMKRSSK